MENRQLNAKLRALIRMPAASIRSKAKTAMDWLTSKMKITAAKEAPKVGLPKTQTELLALRERQRNQQLIGEMYFFAYDPKWKKILPYYDKFPLVFPIEMYSDGFLGLNLHYLDIRNRMILLDHLSTLKNNNKYDESTRLKLSYDAVKGMSNLVKPCVKRYLYSHIRSKFIRIDSSEWDIAIFLPVQNFQKAMDFQVWKDSRKKAR